jgi:hypothetical protein
MITKKAFLHKSNYAILTVFLLSLFAIYVDISNRNSELKNFNGIFTTFVSDSSIIWNLAYFSNLLFYIPMILMIILKNERIEIIFKHPQVLKLYTILEKSPLFVINTFFAVIGSLLALGVLMLFSTKPVENSALFFILAVFLYLFNIMQLSMFLEAKKRLL